MQMAATNFRQTHIKSAGSGGILLVVFIVVIVIVIIVNCCRQLLMSCMNSEIITLRTTASNKLTRSYLMYRKNWRKRWSFSMPFQVGILNSPSFCYV